MDPDDQEKTSFVTAQGTYCYRVKPFGLKNAGATYQRLVNRMFQKQIGRIMEVYIDDMLVKSTTAVIAGLNLAHSLEVDQLEVYSDSQLVVRQIEDTYEAKSGRMILYLRKVRDLLKKFMLVQVKHVPRAENSRADALAKLAIAS